MRPCGGALLVVLLAVGSGCGSVSSTTATGAHAPRPSVHERVRPPAGRPGHSATVHLATGRQTASFALPEPNGVILLYRIRAPAGVRIRGTTQLPSISAPLEIATSPVGPSSGCRAGAARITCTVGEEWCPMPAGTWRVRLHKLGGPPGDVTIWFRVGRPSAKQAG
jgi:hypothetical protein